MEQGILKHGALSFSDTNCSPKTYLRPFSERCCVDVESLNLNKLKPLQITDFTVGLILELWKQKQSVNQMPYRVTGLTPMEMRRFVDGITPQNLNKTCNDLQKKAKMFSKNKKKHELESFKEKQFCLPTSPEQIKKETLTPKSKAIKDLQVENRDLKRSVSKMLSFSEELLDHHDQLVAEQSALELEYYATVERMRVITNNIAGVVVEREREKDNFKKEVKRECP